MPQPAQAGPVPSGRMPSPGVPQCQQLPQPGVCPDTEQQHDKHRPQQLRLTCQGESQSSSQLHTRLATQQQTQPAPPCQFYVNLIRGTVLLALTAHPTCSCCYVHPVDPAWPSMQQLDLANKVFQSHKPYSRQPHVAHGDKTTRHKLCCCDSGFPKSTVDMGVLTSHTQLQEAIHLRLVFVAVCLSAGAPAVPKAADAAHHWLQQAGGAHAVERGDH